MKNPLSIEAFADWCEKQPADGAYFYVSCTNCACAQYARSLGLDFLEFFVADHPWWDAMDSIANRGDHTFGALASRLRSALKEQGR